MSSNFQQFSPLNRPRRLRKTSSIRNLVKETIISPSELVLPLFIHHNPQQKKEITSMPQQFQLGLSELAKEIEEIQSLGLGGVVLFGIPENKDPLGQDAYMTDGIIQQAIRQIKQQAPELLIIADCCFCEYTDHGHCGVIKEQNGHHDLDNDQTLNLLAQAALAQAQAGADIIAPSGMIDGMVGAIRSMLDMEGFTEVPILSYSVKYASSLYGPFREAAEGAPKFGNRQSYQMDFRNAREALREAALDIEEGADMLMVKPASFYLDIIHQLRNTFSDYPLAAYQVSGEYSMIHAAAKMGWLDLERLMMESLISIKRAGADFIITYFAKEAAKRCDNTINF